MLAHGFVDRLTKDIDLFTDRDVAEALSVARGLRTALAAQGLEVRNGPVPPEHRMVVRDPASGRECAVDVFADGGRLQPRVVLDVGPVLHPDDLAADKVLALWARAMPRDFVDVAALTRRYDPRRLMELAAAKDSSFSLSTWADSLAAMRRLTPADWARDGGGTRGGGPVHGPLRSLAGRDLARPPNAFSARQVQPTPSPPRAARPEPLIEACQRPARTLTLLAPRRGRRMVPVSPTLKCRVRARSHRPFRSPLGSGRPPRSGTC